ncbi:hypothetical protein IQ241_15570 [Romeria aff. gracilis LEGE 07310]|uniref:Uncharacterized protein n=1 Tax=Vasconcelosia minhoensis LEGE 07310 TaxID=915328 RepID=A0A8J7DMG4_9CYAN|nr:DUF6679 family protein [Romeria gracilis]MBE9078696.1 hypothetical protein [Romeria aff. gracilis LEGE 07310]
MLHRKIYQLSCDRRDVYIFLRDQQRWIGPATILEVEGDLVTLRCEEEDEDETSSWEEIIRIESIGSIRRQLATVPKGPGEIFLTEDCPLFEKLPDPPHGGE